jgi:hypothetical protein
MYILTYFDLILLIVVPPSRFPAKVRSVRKFDASLLPDFELSVFSDLPIGLVVSHRDRPFSMRSGAESMADMRVEIKCRGVRHCLEETSRQL